MKASPTASTSEGVDRLNPDSSSATPRASPAETAPATAYIHPVRRAGAVVEPASDSETGGGAAEGSSVSTGGGSWCSSIGNASFRNLLRNLILERE